MPPRKVIFLVNHPSAGGVQEIWVNLAQGFYNRGHDVRLMTLYPKRKEVRETPPHLPWHYMSHRRPRTGLTLLLRLVRELKRTRPDIVFTSTPFVNVVTPLAARLAGVKTKVVTSHHSPTTTHSRALNSLDGITGSWSNVLAVVSVSDAVGASLASKSAAYRAKSLTIHNALPPHIEAMLEKIAPAEFVRTARNRKVVATGRLAAQKNYETLLKAAVHMPDIAIDIIGTGPDEDVLKAMAADLGVTDRVNFLGHRPREEALALLSQGDVFAQPSLYEGHSLALIEAAKLKLPLVVSTADTQIEGVTTSAGRKCGTTVETLDDRALASALASLLDDPALYARQMEDAAHLASTISYERLVDAYEAFLERIPPE